jgi:hypothetical protein
MPSAKLAAAVGLAALSLAACGTTSKPEAGTAQAIAKSHKGLDDSRKKHIVCLQQEHITVRREQTEIAGQSLPGFQVDSAPYGPTVGFEPTAGIAQGLQIQGRAQGAEVIGSALLYPNLAPDSLLAKVEKCVALGVSG